VQIHAVVSSKNAGAANADENLLAALGQEMVNNVLSALRQEGVVVDVLEVRLTAEQADTPPRVFTRIHADYTARGTDIGVEQLDRAIQTCHFNSGMVDAMLRAVPMMHTSHVDVPIAAMSRT
jgi:putative redox protein